MFRFTLLPIFLLVGGVVFTFLAFYIIGKIKRTTKQVLKKGSDIANEQQQKWTEVRQRQSELDERKKLPEILQKAYIQLDDIQIRIEELPNEWKVALKPLVDQVNVIVLAVSSKPEMVDHIRSFFHHSLDSLVQLVNKLNTDHNDLNEGQINKVRENITVLTADLMQHQATLQKQKQFDFDVLMDVIKARLKK